MSSNKLNVGPNLVGAKASEVSSFAVANGTEITVNNYANIEWNYNSQFDNSTGIFTAETSGYYDVQWCFVFNGSGTGIRYSYCLVDSVTTAFFGMDLNSPGTGGLSVVGAGMIYLNAGQTAEVKVFQNSGGNLGLASGTFVAFNKVSTGS